MTAVLSDMDAPLGYAVGNALEVAEAVEVLRGGGTPALRTLCLTLAALMAEGALGLPREEAFARAEEALASGTAFSKLCDWVAAQGGDASVLRDTALLPQATARYELRADRDGYLASTDAEAIGHAAVLLGAGRATKEDTIDPTAGILFRKERGNTVARGDVIATLLTSTKENRFSEVAELLKSAIKIAEEPPSVGDVILGIIS